MLHVCMIGFGAIGQAVAQRIQQEAGMTLAQVVVSAPRVSDLKETLGASVAVGSSLDVKSMNQARQAGDRVMVLECAAHAAIHAHVLQALREGFECALLSIGALSEQGLPEALQAAAEQGSTQVHLLSGAIGGIDALAAAKFMGLESVQYVGRKPPLGFKGTHAETVVDLSAIHEPQVLLSASAREASRLYPKNANVAATVSLAGLGLDETQVTLIADPTVDQNIHEVNARGTFGEFHIKLMGHPLPSNPKTSALTVLSAVRFLCNQVRPLTI